MEGVLEGWVKNYRKIEDWKYYKRPSHSHLFQHIIRRANFRDGYNSSAQLVKRGEMDYTLRILADETGLTKKQVENILKDLKNGTEIGTVYTARNQKEFSILSVTNYEKYQGEDCPLEQSVGTAMGTAGGQQGDSRGTAGGHPKERKNVKNPKKGRSKRDKAIPAEIPKGPIWAMPKIDTDFFATLLEFVSHSFQQEQSEKFGIEVIDEELKKIRKWAVDNPRKWEKKVDYERFLEHWFQNVKPKTTGKAIPKCSQAMDKYDRLLEQIVSEAKVITVESEVLNDQ